MTNKLLIILGVVLYICLAVPAAYGLVRLSSSDVTGGKCINEFTIEKFHKTKGVARIPSCVVEVGETQVVIQNMTCDQFSSEQSVNVFRYAHPYFATYSVFMLVATLTIIIFWPIAGFFNWISIKYENWQDSRRRF